MGEPIVAALIAAGGAILVALISLWQHRNGEKDKAEAAETERHLSQAELLFQEHRLLNNELRTELNRVAGERDEWHRRAVTAERRVDEWLQKE